MTSRNYTGILVIGLIYLFAIFLRQPLSYVLNLSILPLSLLCLILGILFFNVIKFSEKTLEGRDFIKKDILQLAIILLGLKTVSYTHLRAHET